MQSELRYVDAPQHKWAAMTEEQLDASYQRAVLRAKRSDFCYWCLTPAALAGILVMVFTFASGIAAFSYRGYIAMFVVFMLWLVTCGWDGALERERDALKPMTAAPLEACEKATALVAGSDGCRAWRDSVLTQGRQLRQFDVDIMRAIEAAEREDRAQAEQAEHETRKTQLCKELHNIPT